MEGSMITRNVSMFMRGIGTLLVIFAHYAQWYITMADGSIIWLLLSKAGRYGVAVFFLVSGYGLVFSAKKGLDARWVKRRVLNVYLPYLCIEGFIHLMERKQWSLNGAIRYIFAMDAWFIFVIIVFYLLFGVVWKFCEHRILWMAAGVTVISFILAVMMKDSVWYASNIAFLIGTAAGEYDEEVAAWFQAGNNRRGICTIVLFVSFLCSGGVYTFYTDRSQAVYLAGKITASALWAMFLLCLFLDQEKTGRLTVRIGAASLEVYLIHIFVLQRLEVLHDRIGTAVVAGLGILISLILGQLLHGLFGGLRRIYQDK